MREEKEEAAESLEKAFARLKAVGDDHFRNARRLAGVVARRDLQLLDVAKAMSKPFGRLAEIERDGIPEGMGPLTDGDAIAISIGELRAARRAIGNCE